MKNEKGKLSFHSEALIKIYLIITTIIGMMITSSCAIEICPTYDASRSGLERFARSTTKRGAKSGYAVIIKTNKLKAEA